MSKKTMAGALLLAGLAVAMVVVPAAAKGTCLEYRYIKVTHMVDPMNMVVTTTRNVRYNVHFTGVCRVGGVYTWNHFVYTDLVAGRCLQARSVLPTSRLSPCFVESVTPIDHQS
jgi:hypothetical protein